jgi:Domain of unknown function (DUF4232)
VIVRIRILVAAAALATVAGCGGGGGSGGTVTGSALPATASATSTTPASGPATTTAPPSTGTGSPSPTGTGTQGVTRCHTSELAASLAPGDPGAGQRYATLTLTNTSGRTCTVFGYGGLQPLDAAKRELPITLTRDTGRPARVVRLGPGQGAGRTIHWGAVPSGEQPCPTPASASIIPPDETDPLLIRWSLGPVCGGKIDGWPYGVTL